MSFVAPVLCDDGTVLPEDPLAGVEIPDDLAELPPWMDDPMYALPADAVDGVSAEVTAAVTWLEASARARRRAEAVEAAALLDLERVFRSEFEAEFGDDAWFEGGGAKCFERDAAKLLGCGRGSAAYRLRVVRCAHDDLPAVWGMFLSGAVGLQQVGVVTAQADGLDGDVLTDFDARCAAVLSGEPGSRLVTLVAGIREIVQARTADERNAKAKALRNVRLEPGRDGMGALLIEGPIERLAAIEQAAGTAAVAAHGLKGETRSIQALRFDVLVDVIGAGFTAAATGDVLVAQRKSIVPTVVLHVPVLTLLGRSDELPTIDGVGPICPRVAKALCAEAPSFFRVLTHPVSGARLTLDRTVYSPPADLRRWVQVRDEYCRFPGCLRAAHLCDLDHVHEWHDVGVTNEDNLIALSRDEHILKSKGLYRIAGDPNGALTFTSPTGIVHTSTPRPPANPVPDRVRRLARRYQVPDECPF